MQKNKNPSTSPDNDDKTDELVEQPKALEEQSSFAEESKPTIPQVDNAISTSAGEDMAEETPETTVATIDAEEEPHPEEAEAEGRVRTIFRKGIRWTVGLLIIFGLGLLTGIFGFYRPALLEAKNSADIMQAEIATANEKITALENQVADLEAEIAGLQPLKTRNEELLAEQKKLNLNIAILDARVDVANAQLALNEQDNTQARIILDQTSNTLNTINQLLESDQKEIVSDLKQRLDLVLEELDDDSFAAQSDMDVLETKLLQLQDSLFGD